MKTRTPVSQLPLVAVSMSVIALAACGGNGTRPGDMSAAEHRRAADDEAAAAVEHSQHRDGTGPPTSFNATTEEADFFGEPVYSPNMVHLDLSGEHRELAAAHRAAARALESYEDAECGAFPAATRASCPLLGQVVSVEDIEGGVRAVFGESVNVDAATAHVACHIAYAGTAGHEGMDGCPLYLRGVRSVRSGPSTVDFTIDGDVAELRARLSAHVAR